MTLLLSLLLGTASAADRSRMRSFYRHACRTDLAIPRGLKIVTGAVLNTTATETEFDLGVRRLATRVRTEPVGNHDFAAYLFALATGHGSWNQAEDFFFGYLERDGNEALAGRLVPEILEILRTGLQFPGVGQATQAARWRFAVGIMRARAKHAIVPWTDLIDELLMGEEPMFGQAVEGLSAGRYTPELCAELNRPVAASFAEIGYGTAPTFISILRLDGWVRSAAGLPGPDRLTDIREHILELSRACTKH